MVLVNSHLEIGKRYFNLCIYLSKYILYICSVHLLQQIIKVNCFL